MPVRLRSPFHGKGVHRPPPIQLDIGELALSELNNHVVGLRAMAPTSCLESLSALARH
jgi:hypothetical protein